MSIEDIKPSRKVALLHCAAVAAILVAASPAWAQSQADDVNDQDILVTGQRLSTQTALAEKKKSANIIDIISADDLGKLPDATVADALARLPGVSTIVNQDTGEGEYVTIRGLSGTYNAVMINGVRVAQTDPGSRDVSLNLLPPFGIAQIRVTKTLTPEQDGDAIGGTLDFRTPTAYDFGKPTVFRLFGTGGYNDRAKSADLPAGIYQIQADVAKRFGDDRFGFFASANYGVSHSNGQETENDGEWEPDVWRKNSEEAIDESNMHLPGIDLDWRRVKQTRFGGNFSFDYHGDTTQLYLRGQIARQELRGTNDTTDYRSRKSVRLTQVNPEDTSLIQPEKAIIGRDATKGAIYSYTTAQIVDADGDGRITDADRNSKQYWSLNGRSGVWNPQTFQFARNFSVIDLNQTLGTLDFGGTSQFGNLQLDYDASYSGGVRENPNNYSISYNCDACTYPLNATGLDWISADPRFPQVSLPAYARDVERTPSLLQFDGLNLDRSKQTDSRLALRFDGKWAFDGGFDYIKFGGKFTRSHREYDYTPIYGGDLSGTALDGKNLAQSGLIETEVTSMLGGQYYYGAVLDRAKVIQAINAAMAANPGVTPSATDLLSSDNQGTEKIYAGYALGHMTLNALQLVGGARVEHRTTQNIFWADDGDNSGFDSTRGDYTVVLPSLTATLRPDDRQVYRAAVWTGYSAPEFGYISGGSTVTRDAGNNEIIAISRGNPDLKPARAVNFDVAAEYYPDRQSIVSAAAYYKKITGFIFTNGSQVNAETQNGTVEVTQPQNGKDAYVLGAEFALVKTFQGMIAPFDGFGFEGNVTVQRSRGETGIPYRLGRKIPLINTPDLLYNAAITYQKYGVQAKLSYSYRGKYIESLRDNAVDKWVQPNRSLDLHTRYNFTRNISVDFDVSNILNDWRYYTTKGDNPSYQKDYMEPGRTIMLRTSLVF